MKLNVSLSKNLSGGAIARVENGDDDSFDLTGPVVSPKSACARAAKILRAAADRFDLLAYEERPYHDDTHRRINAMKLPAQAAKEQA